MRFKQKPSIPILLILLNITLISPKDANAQVSCDACVSASVLTATAAITGSLALINTNLLELGNAIDTQTAGILTNIGVLDKTNREMLKQLINENHVRAEKVETLHSKQTIRDSFGSLSRTNCFETTASMGKILDSTGKAEEVRGKISLFDSTIKSETSNEGRRIKLMREMIENTNLAEFFSSNSLTPEQEELVPVVSHLLTQSRVFPAPAPLDDPTLNASEEVYLQHYRYRDMLLSIPKQVIDDELLGNVSNLDAGELVAGLLINSGVDPSDFVKDGKTSEKALISAIGLSKFGNTAQTEVSELYGDELLRTLILDVGKTNYILSKQYQQLNQQRLINAMILARTIESQLNDITEDAYRGSN